MIGRLMAVVFGRRGVPGGDPAMRRLGRRGERAAVKFLRSRGYRVLGRNVRLRFGEADLVCESPERAIVIVEVKTRIVDDAQRGAPPPEAAVHAHKRRKLLAISRALSSANGWHDRPVRIDVVAVEWRDGARPVIRHHPNAVGAGTGR